MKREIDHLVVAAASLDAGAAWVESALGAATVPGGRHATMGTHNRLLSLGPSCYLEVIAIDPEAPSPGRPRWFGLDEAATRARLARGPVLLHWAERVDDIEAALAEYPEKVEVLDLVRGDFTWRMGVPRDGHLPGAGALPTLIQWKGSAHPAARLPASGCELVELRTSGGLAADFSTPRGRRTLGGE